MSGYAGQEKIGDWNTTTLIKFIRDLFLNQPPDFLPQLKAEEIQVDKSLIIVDKLDIRKEPAFRLIGKPGSPAFANGWGNFGSGWQVAAFWKDALGVVHLRGLISAGTIGQAAFVLPPGHRPFNGSELFSTISNGAIGRVDVLSDGTVRPASPSTNTWVSLSGITFRTS